MPAAILINSLARIRLKVKAMGVVLGLGLTVAAVVGGVLATVLLDYLLGLPAVPRVVVMALAAWGMGYVFWRWVVRCAVSRFSLGDVAGRLEDAFPEFSDRLQSTVDFSSQEIPGSQGMKDRVIAETTELAERLDLNRAVVWTPMWYSLALAAVAVGLMVLVVAVTGSQYKAIALSRLLHPFNAMSWPKRVDIQILTSSPRRVPVGQRVDVKMRLAKGDRSSMPAMVYYRYGQGPIQREYMTRGSDGVYTASLDTSKVSDELKIWMKAGDDQKDMPPIAVVPRLGISRIEASIAPPPYARLSPVTINLATAPAVMAMGSDVTLRVWFNKPLAGPAGVSLLGVENAGKLPAVTWNLDEPAVASGRWTAMQSFRFHVHGTDADGFVNNALEEYELMVRPDQLPTVQIENPRRNEDRTPTAAVPLQVLAEDDYGLKSVRLMVDRLGDKKHWEIDLVRDGQAVSPVVWNKIDSSADQQRFRANYAWELSQLDQANLKSGDVLEYCVAVQDNFVLEGKVHPPVVSGKLRLNIISQEEMVSRLTEELRAAAYQIADLHNRQNRTREETSDLNRETTGKPAMNEADRTVAERLASQQGTIASQTRQVATKMEAMQQRMTENRLDNQEIKNITRDVAEQLSQTAENPMRDASREMTNMAQSTQLPASRDEAFKQALSNQQQAGEQLQKAMDRLGNMGSLQQTMDRIRELLKEQQRLSKETADVARKNLGKTLDQISPEDRARMENTANQQQALAERTAKAMEAMEKTSNQLSKSDPASAEAMKQAQQTGQQQDVPGSQSKAAQSARQNQQSAAQSAQRQAELGLEMMLDKLREAQRRKLEELSRQLEELQTQLANLVRRQAGHNLDNLNLRGANGIGKLAPKAIEELLAKAERTKDQMPDTPLPQLTISQDQTQRNTRDIAAVVENVPGASEPAAHLVKAAGRMERAIVSLRQEKLIDAYDPPQVEALALLEEAKQHIDELKNKVDQERKQQEREAIRQAYIRLRAEQEKLNKETKRIDASPRLADGQLKREEVIRLGRLPGEQGTLAEGVQKLSKDLVSLGGIVYLWANKDIVDSMNEVKADLDKKVIGGATQEEQTGIIEQLDAMIANLALKPLEKKFADRSGGGGGGSGSGGKPPPTLPPEAELRLLKYLQSMINRGTKTAAAMPQADSRRLQTLAQREGDLRRLLSDLLQKSSQGQIKLGPEVEAKEQLPEEIGAERAEDRQLDVDLLTQGPTAEHADKEVEIMGTRMARSRQRLGINKDPGKTTQVIQERIIKGLDNLIEMARQQQANQQSSPSSGQASSQSKPQSGSGEQPANQQAGGQKSQPNAGNTSAKKSTLSPGGNSNADLSQDIRQTMREWGGLTQRQRDAVIEGSSEHVVEKYKKLVDDYYRSLSTKAAQRQPNER